MLTPAFQKPILLGAREEVVELHASCLWNPLIMSALEFIPEGGKLADSAALTQDRDNLVNHVGDARLIHYHWRAAIPISRIYRDWHA